MAFRAEKQAIRRVCPRPSSLASVTLPLKAAGLRIGRTMCRFQPCQALRVYPSYRVERGPRERTRAVVSRAIRLDQKYKSYV
jgi:hypothetical protein